MDVYYETYLWYRKKQKSFFIFVVSRTIFIKTNNFRRIRHALLAYVRCGGLALKGLCNYQHQAAALLCTSSCESVTLTCDHKGPEMLVALSPTYINILCVHEGTECLYIFHILLSQRIRLADTTPVSVISGDHAPPSVVIHLNTSSWSKSNSVQVLCHCERVVLLLLSACKQLVSYHITTVLLPNKCQCLQVFYISHFDTYKLQCNDYIILWCKFIVRTSELYLLHFD